MNKRSNTLRGFTLIELLVVVLIIGILAAVALPQYQLAVAKSKIMSMMPLIASMKESYEFYYMEEGEYPENLNQLELKLPQSCSISSDNVQVQCGKDILIIGGYKSNKMEGMFMMSYCPGKNRNNTTCHPVRDLVLTFYLSRPNRENNQNLRIPNTTLCEPRTTWGRKLCNSMLGTVVDKIYP